MNQSHIGTFISKCRKEKGLTQAQLAELLNITDRAVSKWETGKSMPDSSIMLDLCRILGISVNELLSGEKIEMEKYKEKLDENLIKLKKKDEINLNTRKIIGFIYTGIMILGAIICLICNFAINGFFSWSLIPLSSIIFVWLMTIPLILMGRKGIVRGLIICSILIIPYLYVLSEIIDIRGVFTYGAVYGLLSVSYIWCVYFIFKRFSKRMVLAIAYTLIMTIVLKIAIDVATSKMFNVPMIDAWNILSLGVLLILTLGLFLLDATKNKKS